MDQFDVEKRSEIMKAVHSKNTQPEIFVRKLIHTMGYRYRLHKKNLPGTPDLVFKSRGKVIFVNGCFWHGHTNCARATIPKSRTDFWKSKIAKNINRDQSVRQLLEGDGWQHLTIWQCEIKNIESLMKKIVSFLDG